MTSLPCLIPVALQEGTVEVNGWLLAGGAAAIVAVFVVWQMIQKSRADRAREEILEQGPAVMEEARFWDLVQQAKRQASGDMLKRPSELNGILRDVEPLDVAAFHERYTKELERADKPSLRAIADAFIKNCTDSNFVAFRDWLISEGRETFDRVVADPSSLPAPVGKEIVTLEAFGYVAPRVYKSKAGKPISRAIEDQIAAATGE
ncbi:hypothetical protein Poly30_49730 [Planctomycetes bacterium Poly30]|uniref:DUF4240 domain-containing protein n=1 Tax=Saltatorellus ferox TaxID=2528018 RepID=A0A518EZ97_9BACT|nr:hypothetical protein Poly30_49730 [Planctomycetes bacterium Poly30]